MPKPQKFILTGAEIAAIRAKLVPLAYQLGRAKYGSQMYDEAMYFDYLMEILSPERYELWDSEVEAHGEAPLPSVSAVLDGIEIELFGEALG